MMSKKDSESFSFTLRTCRSDVNTSELIAYLHSLGRSVANRKIEDALMKSLLSLAKQHSGKYTSEQLRLSCLDSIDALASHSSYLRQAFNIGEPQQLYSDLPTNPAPDLNRSTGNNPDSQIPQPSLGEAQRSKGVNADNINNSHPVNNSAVNNTHPEVQEEQTDSENSIARADVNLLNSAFDGF